MCWSRGSWRRRRRRQPTASDRIPGHSAELYKPERIANGPRVVSNRSGLWVYRAKLRVHIRDCSEAVYIRVPFVRSNIWTTMKRFYNAIRQSGFTAPGGGRYTNKFTCWSSYAVHFSSLILFSIPSRLYVQYLGYETQSHVIAARMAHQASTSRRIHHPAWNRSALIIGYLSHASDITLIRGRDIHIPGLVVLPLPRGHALNRCQVIRGTSYIHEDSS